MKILFLSHSKNITFEKFNLILFLDNLFLSFLENFSLYFSFHVTSLLWLFSSQRRLRDPSWVLYNNKAMEIPMKNKNFHPIKEQLIKTEFKLNKLRVLFLLALFTN